MEPTDLVDPRRAKDRSAYTQGRGFLYFCAKDAMSCWILRCRTRWPRHTVQSLVVKRQWKPGVGSRPLLQAYCNVSDRDVVALTVMDKRWQMVLDCLDAAQPPFSQGTLFNFRMRLLQHNLDKTLLERTVALAEKTGGFGARQLRAVLDSTPLFGAGRAEDTFNLLGHALRKIVRLAAKELNTSVAAIVADAGLRLVGHSSLKAALDLDWGAPTAREKALDLSWRR